MLSILNRTKSVLPFNDSFFKKIKKEILGEQYDLSLVFIGKKLSEELNNRYRKKKGPANVLSFPLTEESGEIFINLSKAKKESEALNVDNKEFVGLLFIHSLLHLKGFQHSNRMIRKEQYLRKRYFNKSKIRLASALDYS